MEKEIWKDITGYEGLYQISNLGRVKSLSRKVITKSRWGENMERTVKELFLTPVLMQKYYSVTLCREGSKKMYRIHRLVAFEFLQNPENKIQVNHINGIKTDNSANNLEWCTCSENILHSYRVLGKSPNKTGIGKFGIKNGKSRSVIQYSLNGNYITKYDCINDAKRATGISQSKISLVCSGKRNKAGGYLWKFTG